jgi:hypothetical protein
MVEPLRASGRLTLKAELTTERMSRIVKSKGCSNCALGASRTSRAAPVAMTAPTYSLATRGSDFMVRDTTRQSWTIQYLNVLSQAVVVA